eukprot:331334-Prymnesium_polylepis.1
MVVCGGPGTAHTLSWPAAVIAAERASPTRGRNLVPSEPCHAAIRGTQWQSEALSGNQRHS